MGLKTFLGLTETLVPMVIEAAGYAVEDVLTEILCALKRGN